MLAKEGFFLTRMDVVRVAVTVVEEAVVVVVELVCFCCCCCWTNFWVGATAWTGFGINNGGGDLVGPFTCTYRVGLEFGVDILCGG